jgi:release factor glutamine methyltransferase
LTTISQALAQSVEILQEISDTPNLDAQILLANTLNKPRAWVISHPEERLSLNQFNRYQACIKSLAEGTPLPYIIGSWEFYGLNFNINPQTLIPRPETEILVELALGEILDKTDRLLGADVGTGSGCIAIALAKNYENFSIIASDISLPALRIAKKNSEHHNVNHQILFLQADLLPPVAVKYDIICANLPYIPSGTLQTLKIFGHEPGIALDGGKDGLDHISKLLEISPAYTKSGTIILIEFDSTQASQVQSIARKHFPTAEINIFADLAEQDRVIKIQIPDNQD